MKKQLLTEKVLLILVCCFLAACTITKTNEEQKTNKETQDTESVNKTEFPGTIFNGNSHGSRQYHKNMLFCVVRILS